MPMNPAVKYPYIHPDGAIEYVGAEDPFIQQAKAYAKVHSLDKAMPNATVLVKDGAVIGRGANGSTYHDTHPCERIRLNIPTGQGYELCEGCHPDNHSEPTAIKDAREHGNDTSGAVAYLWGHWWCCEPCWKSMVSAGITTVRLVENSDVLFDKTKPGNIVGKQFDDALPEDLVDGVK